MAGFEKISCDWSEPCFLNYSVKECWGDNWFTLPLDVFSMRPAAEDVDYSIAELEHLISGAGVPVPWEELIPARTALRASMIEALEECRQRLDLVSRPFVKTTLAKVLDLGPDAVAFYVAFTRDADGHSRTRMRAHTFRHVDGERLWFEYRLPILLRPERVLATAQGLLGAAARLSALSLVCRPTGGPLYSSAKPFLVLSVVAIGLSWPPSLGTGILAGCFSNARPATRRWWKKMF